MEREQKIKEEELLNDANIVGTMELEKKMAEAKSTSVRYWEEQLELVRKQRGLEKEAQLQLNKNKIIE
jgi:hypothetical protein